MHLFFPGHLFSGLFLLSQIWITTFFLYALCLTHILSLYCLVVIVFCTYTSCLIAPTCNTHLTSVMSGTEMMVWSHMNALYLIWGVHSTTTDPELRNESFSFISFMGFPPILSRLQPFEICILNTKNSKLTFSNGSQLMGKRFMANLHTSLDTTCKSGISKISTTCQNWGLSIPQLLILNSEMNLKIFPILGGLHPHTIHILPL